MEEELFGEILSFAEARTGIVTPVSHKSHVRRELEKIFQKSGLSPEEYFKRLMHNEKEQERFFNIVTINETYFFREERHFNFLEKNVLPQLYREKKNILLWSVSCSSGEEAVSLALLAESLRDGRKDLDYSVYATDINSRLLEKFASGIFHKTSFRKDGKSYHPLLERYLEVPGEGHPGHGYVLSPAVLSKIIIKRVNIHSDSLDFIPRPVDIAFFRNTLLYVTLKTREEILRRIFPKIAPGGYLFLASSEVPFLSLPGLILKETEGVYFFQKDGPGHGPEASAVLRPASGEKRQEKDSIRKSCSISPDRDGEDSLFLSPGREEAGDGEPGITGSENASLAKSFLDSVNREDFPAAEEFLEQLKERIPLSAAALFLEGWYNKGAGEPDKAVLFFEEAVKKNRDFWPARFYLALSISAEDPSRAKKEFLLCYKNLMELSEKERDKYALLLEGFDPAYFSHICEKWIEKIGKEGEKNSPKKTEDWKSGRRSRWQ
jgi:chemotaxis protein methyltransferase CheR